VLRLSRDRLLVSLAPSTVSWVRLSGGFRPRVVSKHSLTVAGETGPEPWDGAVALLREEAEQLRRERLAVTVVLSNHFVRYTVVPPLDHASSRNEALALARFHFSKIHGERAAGWDVRLASPPSAKPTLASAIDSALLEALKACFPREGSAHLASVQPYTMSAFNFWRHKVGSDGAWLLLVEPGTACLAMLAGKDWATIQSVKSGYASSDNWPALLDREKHRVTTRSVPRIVLTRSTVPPSSALTARKDWHFIALEPPALPGITQGEREPYAMALHAA
jgi:hypothetical protein